MSIPRTSQAMERRLRAIDRERRRVRTRIREVKRWAESLPESDVRLAEAALREMPVEAIPPPLAVDVLDMETEGMPAYGESVDFEPGPEGLDTKRVIMPRLQRTDLLRPAIGGQETVTRLMPPAHDRFRSYFGTTGLKRVREARQDRGRQRLRALFMILMVLGLGFILFKMVT
ncbi:MAG: hypothetical protein PHO14_05785 [Kiritimatiellae bacterium]|nr:hypothetical protein [Kiritimatiellia bacterium]MDD4341728.1 hypothetical protein [Kiritimatiellia bacterium]